MQTEILEYAELGYETFPCATGGKNPLTKRGLLDATSDTDQIETWLEQCPTANWAIRTEGLLVIDVDPGAESWPQDAEQAESLAATPVIARTPRGGRHYWFRQPDGADYRNTQGVLAEHVDTRANGGYVVVAPSAVNGNAYSWVNGAPEVGPDELPLPPQWVLDKLAQRSAVRIAELPSDDDTIPDGQRNGSLTKLAGAMRRVGATEADMLAALRSANASRCKPPMEESEVATIAHSVARYTPEELKQLLAQVEAQEFEGDDDNLPPDPGALPSDLQTVPGFISDVMQLNLAGAYKPQPTLALAGALTLLAALTGRKVTDTQGTRTNLYAIGVACGWRGRWRRSGWISFTRRRCTAGTWARTRAVSAWPSALRWPRLGCPPFPAASKLWPPTSPKVRCPSISIPKNAWPLTRSWQTSRTASAKPPIKRSRRPRRKLTPRLWTAQHVCV